MMDSTGTLLTRLKNYASHGHLSPCCRALLSDCLAEVDRLQGIAKQHRETAEAYRDKYQRVKQAMGHVLTIAREAEKD